MCGIFGMVGRPHTGRFQAMGYANSSRGRDAIGVAAMIPHEKCKVFKAPGSWGQWGRSKAVQRILEQPAWSWVGHLRHATSGAPGNNVNNHPIITDFHVGVHNGMIFSLPSEFGITCRGQVDSELLFRILDSYGRDAFQPRYRTPVYGWGVIVYWDIRDSMKLWVACSDGSLAYARRDETVYFSSSFNALKHQVGVESYKFIPQGVFCWFDPEGELHTANESFHLEDLHSYYEGWWEEELEYFNKVVGITQSSKYRVVNSRQWQGKAWTNSSKESDPNARSLLPAPVQR